MDDRNLFTNDSELVCYHYFSITCLTVVVFILQSIAARKVLETAVSLLKCNFLQSVPPSFENEGSAFKTHKMFSVHTMPEEFKIATIMTGHFEFLCLRKTRSGKSCD